MERTFHLLWIFYSVKCDASAVDRLGWYIEKATELDQCCKRSTKEEVSAKG